MKFIVSMAVAWSCIAAFGQSIPIEVVRNRIIVSATVGDSEAGHFAIDSALPVPVIHVGAVERFGVSLDENDALDMPGPDGQFVRAIPGALPGMRVGSLSVTAVDCVAMDLTPISDRLGTPIDGLINISHLGPVVSVDIARKMITVSLRSGPQANGALMRRGADGSWMVGIVLNDAVAADAVIDLSYAGTVSVPEEFADNRGLIAGDMPILDAGGGAATTRLKRLRVGDATMDSPLCDLMATGSQLRIGMGFLSRWPVTLDMKSSQLVVGMTEESEADTPLVGFGMALVRQVPGGWEVAVAEGTPASEGGVVTGDRLTAVDGEFVGGLTYDEVAAYLAIDEGKSVECRMERAQNASVFKVRLIARRLL